MRVARVSKPGAIEQEPVEVAEVPVPAAGPGELLVRVSCCAVCRTDLQIVEGDIEARRLPVVPGHQLVGAVETVGAGVSGWTVGDRVGAAWLAGACGSCRYCRAGRENLCEEARFTGWDRDGGFGEFALVDADFALRLPDGFSDVEAAPLLCGGIIGYRALRVAGVEPRMRVGLFGFGASASLALQVAFHWGCQVYVATRSTSEQQRARDLGATWAAGYDADVPVELDAAVTFAPAGSVVVAALRAVGRGGTVAINAIHLDRIPEFPYDLLWWERQLRSVANFTRQDAREFLELAAAIPIRTAADVYPISDANRALQDLKAGRVTGAAVLAMDR